MLESIFFGATSGFILSFGFGSVFFALIQESIDKGSHNGIKMAFGVLVSDMLLVLLAILGTSAFPDIPNFQLYAKTAACIILVSMGISQFFYKKPNIQFQNPSRKISLISFGKGFLLNAINPVNFLSWVVLLTAIKSQNYTIGQQMGFFSTSLIVIFSTESLIAYYSFKIRKIASEGLIKKIKMVNGFIFIFLAIMLWY
jgi:threonine/homoserine/homoserine lactone efflux protein